MDQDRGLKALESLVLGRGLCTMCGACARMCPYLETFNGRIVKLHECDLQEGRCFAHCPRTALDLAALNRNRFGSEEVPLELGFQKRVLMGRGLDPGLRGKAQTGGTVSSLVALALEEGLVDAAVLTQRGKDLLPAGRIVSRREEVLECAGSSYVASPSLAALNKGPWQGHERIALVGVPCQIWALEKMRLCELNQDAPARKVVLSIGLFCTWALSYTPFVSFLRRKFPSEVVEAMDITPPPERILRIRTSSGSRDVPVEEIRPFVQPACTVCADMTSELADLSVGTVEGEPGWNTLIIRTSAGESILDRALARGVLEVKDLPAPNAQHLAKASMLKKRRALEAIKQMEDGKGGYLLADSRWLERVRLGTEGGEQ